MKSTRYTEEQIIRILGGGGRVGQGSGHRMPTIQPVGSHGTSLASKYRDMDQEPLRRLRELEAENSRLKKIVAQQAIDLDAMKELVGKAW
jgi:putative transposase